MWKVMEGVILLESRRLNVGELKISFNPSFPEWVCYKEVRFTFLFQTTIIVLECPVKKRNHILVFSDLPVGLKNVIMK